MGRKQDEKNQKRSFFSYTQNRDTLVIVCGLYCKHSATRKHLTSYFMLSTFLSCQPFFKKVLLSRIANVRFYSPDFKFLVNEWTSQSHTKPVSLQTPNKVSLWSLTNLVLWRLFIIKEKLPSISIGRKFYTTDKAINENHFYESSILRVRWLFWEILWSL